FFSEHQCRSAKRRAIPGITLCSQSRIPLWRWQETRIRSLWAPAPSGRERFQFISWLEYRPLDLIEQISDCFGRIGDVGETTFGAVVTHTLEVTDGCYNPVVPDEALSQTEFHFVRLVQDQGLELTRLHSTHSPGRSQPQLAMHRREGHH